MENTVKTKEESLMSENKSNICERWERKKNINLLMIRPFRHTALTMTMKCAPRNMKTMRLPQILLFIDDALFHPNCVTFLIKYFEMMFLIFCLFFVYLKIFLNLF